MFSKRYIRILAWAFVALAVAGSCGCVDGVARRRAEREIERLLPGLIGPASSYSVSVEGSASQISRGKLRRVLVSGSQVTPTGLPQFSRLDAELGEVNVDVAARRLVSCGSAKWSGRLTAGSLGSLMAGRIPQISDHRLELTQGTVCVTGTAKWMRVSARVSLEATAALRNGREVWMTPKRFTTLGVGFGIPEWGGKRLEPFLNPVYTIPENSLGITADTLEVLDSELLLAGTLDPSVLLARLGGPKTIPSANR